MRFFYDLKLLPSPFKYSVLIQRVMKSIYWPFTKVVTENVTDLFFSSRWRYYLSYSRIDPDDFRFSGQGGIQWDTKKSSWKLKIYSFLDVTSAKLNITKFNIVSKSIVFFLILLKNVPLELFQKNIWIWFKECTKFPQILKKSIFCQILMRKNSR